MTLFDSIFAGENGIASTLLTTLGTTVTYIKASEKSFDPRLDIYVNGADTEIICKASPILKYNSFEKKDSDIQEGDCKLIISVNGLSTIVDTQDKIRANNLTYVIVKHSYVNTGTTNVIATLQLREVK